MPFEIRLLGSDCRGVWDAYVSRHPRSTLYHLCGWESVVKRAYGHRTYYLMALDSSKLKVQCSKDSSVPQELSPMGYEGNSDSVVGILPLVHLKHPVFGNNLVSIPFFDMGGILANDSETEATLLCTALVLAGRLKVDTVELRQTHSLGWEAGKLGSREVPEQRTEDRRRTTDESTLGWVDRHALSAMRLATKSHKVRMVLRLPESSALLMDSFKAKLRSQIKKPMKEGLTSKIGGREMLGDFYKVFSVNMRDLGSPVHSRDLIAQVLEVFYETARIVMIYKNDSPVACSVIVGFGEMMENPWASALREYSRLSPNMLLYWSMLTYACDHGFRYFDFGRSSPDEGTYRFKEQWGAKPQPLDWHYVSLNGKSEHLGGLDKSRFGKAIEYWQKLPVPVTRVIGPRIRKYISL